MPLGQIQTLAREIKRIYQAPAGKRASASVNVHAPIGGSFALAVSSSDQTDRLLDQFVFRNGTSNQAGFRVVVSRDGVYMAKSSTNQVEIWKQVAGVWSFLQVISGLSTVAIVATAQSGVPVAFSADASRLLIGENGFSNSNTQQGRAQVYTRSGDTFSLAYSINTPTPVNQGYFGTSVDISGDGLRAVIGAPGESVVATGDGRVYVYSLGPTSATQLITPISPQAGNPGAYAGFDVCISDNGVVALTNAWSGDNSVPIVFVYGATNGSQFFQVSGPNNASRFGDAIDISADGSVLVIGERTANTNAGQVLVYRSDVVQDGADVLTSNGYSLVATLAPTGNTSAARFGYSVNISSDKRFIAVGANNQDNTGFDNEGLVYLFRRNQSTYDLMDTFTPLTRRANQQAGEDVCVASTATSLTLFSSTYQVTTASGNSPGLVYVYDYPLATAVTDEVVNVAAGSAIEKTGLVLEPGDSVYLISRTPTPINALAVGFVENA